MVIALHLVGFRAGRGGKVEINGNILSANSNRDILCGYFFFLGIESAYVYDERWMGGWRYILKRGLLSIDRYTHRHVFL